MTNPFSPGGELWVDPSHLRDLADKHGAAAARINRATELVDGVADAVTRTHGNACSAAAAAAVKAAEARKRACIALETTSQAHEANLNTAAAQYVSTDMIARRSIDGEMPE